jgi:hypothetical protein
VFLLFPVFVTGKLGGSIAAALPGSARRTFLGFASTTLFELFRATTILVNTNG